MSDIAVIGAGVVGTAVATLLKERGYNLVGIAGRNYERTKNIATILNCSCSDKVEKITSQAEIIFITTSDSAIAEVVASIASNGGIHSGQTVIHMSGALPSSILTPAKECGAQIVSIHPLQSFADTERAIENLPGSFFTIEGDSKAYSLAEKIVTDLGGQCFYIEEKDKALYHAAACIASNYLVSLIDYSLHVFELIGIPQGKGLEALLPLIQGSVNNLKKLGTAKALTGPIARGDKDTVKKHLMDMREKKPELAELYQQLGLYTVEVAIQKGSIDSFQAKELINFLKGDMK